MVVPRTAVVLFNLGAPDRPEAVRPFLVNLFSDREIIDLAWPLRTIVARLIAHWRTREATAIYQHLGGASPLLANTRAQAAALQAALGEDTRVFTAMRHWHPFSPEVAREVAAWGPDEVVLLPLYPQFSTTTTASSLATWRRAASAAGLVAPSRAICCYPSAPGLVEAHTGLIEAAVDTTPAPFRLLFSAHGLPERIVARGDPYQWQVEQTAAAVAAAIEAARGIALDWRVCYQSRVGPLAWIGPPTEDELRRAGADGVNVILAPVAFVSEHSETLVELDITYRQVAAKAGVPRYHRVPALGTTDKFIAALATLVRMPLGADVSSQCGERLCPRRFNRCPQPVT